MNDSFHVAYKRKYLKSLTAHFLAVLFFSLKDNAAAADDDDGDDDNDAHFDFDKVKQNNDDDDDEDPWLPLNHDRLSYNDAYDGDEGHDGANTLNLRITRLEL